MVEIKNGGIPARMPAWMTWSDGDDQFVKEFSQAGVGLLFQYLIFPV
ncbi:MAG TPA: hypothetical protein VLS85_11640 [Hanamia sp.]|nr:hypothetical protein [Hanamia sp.]